MKHQRSVDNTSLPPPGSGHNTPPPGTRSQHLSSPAVQLGKNIVIFAYISEEELRSETLINKINKYGLITCEIKLKL